LIIITVDTVIGYQYYTVFCKSNFYFIVLYLIGTYSSVGETIQVKIIFRKFFYFSRTFPVKLDYSLFPTLPEHSEWKCPSFPHSQHSLLFLSFFPSKVLFFGNILNILYLANISRQWFPFPNGSRGRWDWIAPKTRARAHFRRKCLVSVLCMPPALTPCEATQANRNARHSQPNVR